MFDSFLNMPINPSFKVNQKKRLELDKFFFCLKNKTFERYKTPHKDSFRICCFWPLPLDILEYINSFGLVCFLAQAKARTSVCH